MLPQNYYAQGFRLGMDKHGDFVVMRHIPGQEDEVETDKESLDMLMDLDSTVWETWDDGFSSKTVEAFCEYFAEDDDEVYDGPAKTDCRCGRCGKNVILETSDMEYPFYCIECDENMYSFEVLCPDDVPTYRPIGDNTVIFTLMDNAQTAERRQEIADKAVEDLFINDSSLQQEYADWAKQEVYLKDDSDG